MKALNVRQEEVLAWIGGGCLEHHWPDYTHRATAKVLQTQGLVKVNTAAVVRCDHAAVSAKAFQRWWA
jgi:hypothetical protein